MPKFIVTETLTITAGGGTELISVGSLVERIVIVPDAGAVTLVANQIISVEGTPTQGLTYDFEYNGGVTLDGNTFDIFGYQLSDAEALAKYIITASFLDGIFQVKLALSANDGAPTIDGSTIQPATITSTEIESGALSLDDIAPLSGEGLQLVSDASGVLVELDATGSGFIQVGNNTTVAPVLMNGAITMDQNGLTTLGLGVVSEENLSFSVATPLEVRVLVPSAQVLDWANTPIQLVASPGAGFYIEVISASAYIFFNTTPYNGGVDCQIRCAGATLSQYFVAIVARSVSTGQKYEESQAVPIATDSMLVDNQPLEVFSAVNPMTGDSDIQISVSYRIVQI